MLQDCINRRAVTHFTSPFPSPKLALGATAVLAALSLSPGQAQAALTYRVTVNSLQYDVTTFTGSYNDNASKFATAANGGVMPWWGSGSGSLARDFTTAVGTNLGTPNLDRGTNYGPYFGQGLPSALFVYRFRSSTDSTSTALSASRTYAQATLYTPSASVPGTLPLFGAGAAFSFSRKLRKRIKVARKPLATSQH